MRIIFDIETSMLSSEDEGYSKSKFHTNARDMACLCAMDIDTKDSYVFHDNPDLDRNGSNLEGVSLLMKAELLSGHNIRGFDIPALIHLYPEETKGINKIQMFDTLFASRQLFTWADLTKYDKKHNVKHNTYNTKATHSLGAWGDRLRDRLGLDLAKDDEFKKNADWANLVVNKALVDYCLQDVVVNTRLFEILMKTHNKRIGDGNG